MALIDMKGRFLVSSNEDPAEGNVYADKSSLVLDWLLREGLSIEGFSLREVAKEAGVILNVLNNFTFELRQSAEFHRS